MRLRYPYLSGSGSGLGGVDRVAVELRVTVGRSHGRT